MREAVIIGASAHRDAAHRLPVGGHVTLGFNEDSLVSRPLRSGSEKASGSKFYKQKGADTGPDASPEKSPRTNRSMWELQIFLIAFIKKLPTEKALLYRDLGFQFQGPGDAQL